MRMPQDFLDAINAAVREVNLNAGTTTYGDMFLGSDFDEWLGPGAINKLSPEAAAAFEAKFNEKRDELMASLVASAVEIEKRRMAGDLGDSLPRASKPSIDVRELVAKLGG